MLYLLAIFLPPVAVFLCGKPGQALLNLILSLCCFFPGLIHALCIVANHYADKRNEKLIGALSRGQAQGAKVLDVVERTNKLGAMEWAMILLGGVVLILLAVAVVLFQIRSSNKAPDGGTSATHAVTAENAQGKATASESPPVEGQTVQTNTATNESTATTRESLDTFEQIQNAWKTVPSEPEAFEDVWECFNWFADRTAQVKRIWDAEYRHKSGLTEIQKEEVRFEHPPCFYSDKRDCISSKLSQFEGMVLDVKEQTYPNPESHPFVVYTNPIKTKPGQSTIPANLEVAICYTKKASVLSFKKGESMAIADSKTYRVEQEQKKAWLISGHPPRVWLIAPDDQTPPVEQTTGEKP